MAAVPATSPAADDPVALSETDHYNQGVALYRAEQFQESADAFRKAAAASDPLLAARARFNLGNADYARAVASIDSQDPSAAAEAIESLRSAIESYRSALRIAPKDDDARFNLELASKLMRQLEQQQQQQQGQEGQEPQQDKEEQEAGEQEEQNGESQPEQQQQQSSQPENEQPENEQPDEQPNESSSGENQEGDGDNQESEKNPQANEGEQDSNDQPQQQQPDGSGAEPQDQASADPAEQDRVEQISAST